jgi:alkylation response protein AidB-like acyl-CoA dehydrogenase
VKMLGNTLLRWGTPEQQAHFLPRAVSGVDRWCQGFSEPGAGSDLAGLSMRGELVGDRWVLHGQKVWTSLAHLADWVFVLARTDPAAAKHRGISFLLCPLDQPGIERRRIRTLGGEAEFCEVFFDGAEVDPAHVVGPLHGGWAVANTLLGFERG